MATIEENKRWLAQVAEWAVPEKFARAQTYILQARRANPEHRQLADLAKFYRKLAPPGTPIIEEA